MQVTVSEISKLKKLDTSIRLSERDENEESKTKVNLRRGMEKFNRNMHK
jgi:hypothetical protein